MLRGILTEIPKGIPGGILGQIFGETPEKLKKKHSKLTQETLEVSLKKFQDKCWPSPCKILKEISAVQFRRLFSTECFF